MKKFLITALITILSVSAYSQSDKNGGSIYSIFGLGELTYSASTRTDGMGVMGLSMYGDYTNTFNPAAWTRIQSTIFTTKFNFDNISATDGTYQSERTYGNFESFGLSIPLNKGNGWVLSVGLDNYSLVNFDANFTSSVDGEQYLQTYSGNGGLNRLNAGFSYIIFRDFSFGLQFNYLFGNTKRSTEVNFVNPLLFDTQNRTEDQMSGFYFNTGLIYHGFAKLFRSKKFNNMNLGLYFSTPAKLTSSVSGIYYTSVSQTDSSVVAEGDVEVPLSFGAGLSNLFGDRLTVAADFHFQNWDNYKYHGSHPERIKNSLRVGAGFEFAGLMRPEEPYYKRISLRLGGFYKQENLRLLGEDITSYGITTGLSLPIGRFNSVDLLGEYFIRGKATGGLVKEDVFRFGATVRIGELWFLRPSDDF